MKIHPTYLSKLFSKEVGMSFKEFIMHARVKAAKNMLVYSDFSYMDIALSLGFSSQSAFISTFGKLTGLTPGKYRALYQDNDSEPLI